MVAKRQCSFCAQEIEPGTGTIFVKRDGTVYQFCSSSCRKQQLHLGRIGHRFKWTRAYELRRAAERSSAERGGAASVPRAPVRRARPAAAPATTPAAEPSPPPEPASEPPAKKSRASAAPKAAGKPSAKSGSKRSSPTADPSSPPSPESA